MAQLGKTMRRWNFQNSLILTKEVASYSASGRFIDVVMLHLHMMRDRRLVRGLDLLQKSCAHPDRVTGPVKASWIPYRLLHRFGVLGRLTMISVRSKALAYGPIVSACVM